MHFQLDTSTLPVHPSFHLGSLNHSVQQETRWVLYDSSRKFPVSKLEQEHIAGAAAPAAEDSQQRDAVIYRTRRAELLTHDPRC